MSDYFIIAGLAAVMGLTLALPFSSRRVEQDLEAFLFVMGMAAVSISGLWSLRLIIEALKGPLAITATVACAGWLFRAVRPRMRGWLAALTARIGLKASVFVIVAALGLGSSVLTAVVGAIILAETITLLQLSREREIKITVYACYAIGLGAALTPLGEPLSTIVASKLKGLPHEAGFFYLIKQVGAWIVPAIIAAAALASRGAVAALPGEHGLKEDRHDTGKDIILRAGKVYIFVVALIFLGAGLEPLAARFMAGLPEWALYWANSVSAILDNATLAAAEISPVMTSRQLTFALMGMLISGGMLIPGNIPNIVSSAKLGIKSREWAEAALPFGAGLMAVCFVLMSIFVK